MRKKSFQRCFNSPAPPHLQKNTTEMINDRNSDILSINTKCLRQKHSYRNTTVAQLQEGAVVSSVVHRVLTEDELLWSEFRNTIFTINVMKTSVKN